MPVAVTRTRLQPVQNSRKGVIRPSRSAEPAYLIIARRPAGAAERGRQREALLESAPDRVEREILVAAIRLDRAQRHGLNQGEVVALVRAPEQHRLDLVFVEAFERDHVDLDPKPRGGCRFDTAQNLRQLAEAGNVAEALGATLRGDIDPPHARAARRSRSGKAAWRWW